MNRWLVFYDSDFSVEADTPQEAAERYAERNDAEFGQTLVVIPAGPTGPAVHRFRLGAVPEEATA